MGRIKHVVITAAGMGTRLGLQIPKCMVEVAGRRIVDHQLPLLEDVEDFCMVVGYKSDEVMAHVRRSRPDARFVVNHAYASTTTLQSLFLATRDLDESFLVVDGDVIPEADSFKAFLAHCGDGRPLTAVSPAVSTEAVYAIVDEASRNLVEFTRAPVSAWEWPGISWLRPSMIENRPTFVYQQLCKHLPLRVQPLECWEVDTVDDLARVSRELSYDARAPIG
jgi:choline kinase